jgi:cell wall-associated NlpC family hydrolase
VSASADPVALAARLIGHPYVWGAEGPRSFDCSGLVQYVHREHGVDLPRRAVNQSQVGDRVQRGLRRGDLLFFSSDERRSLVTHVGIYEGNGVMIDASKRHGRVRRDSLDDEYWAERFMFARRISQVTGSGDSAESRPEVRAPHSNRERAAVRVLQGIAGVLLRRPRR